MSESASLAPQPHMPDAPSSGHGSLNHPPGYWLGLMLMLVGDILIIAAIFLPWIEVYKNDPSLPMPRRGYSPWMALQQNGIDAFGVMVSAYFLLVLGFVVSTLILARTSNARLRILAITIALALVGVVVVSWMLYAIPVGLALNYPYYDTNVISGGFLAIAGFLCAFVGAVIVVIVEMRRARPSG